MFNSPKLDKNARDVLLHSQLDHIENNRNKKEIEVINMNCNWNKEIGREKNRWNDIRTRTKRIKSTKDETIRTERRI